MEVFIGQGAGHLIRQPYKGCLRVVEGGKVGRLPSSYASTVCITHLNKLNLVKLCYGGLVLGSRQLLILPQLAQIMILASKVVKNDSK